MSQAEFNALMGQLGVDQNKTFPVNATGALDAIEKNYGELPFKQTL